MPTPTYTIAELIGGSQGLLGVEPYIAAGAFFGVSGPLTADAAQSRLAGWLATVVSTPPGPGPAPVPQYAELLSHKDQPNGYPGLNSAGLLAAARLPVGVPGVPTASASPLAPHVLTAPEITDNVFSRGETVTFAKSLAGGSVGFTEAPAGSLPGFWCEWSCRVVQSFSVLLTGSAGAWTAFVNATGGVNRGAQNVEWSWYPNDGVTPDAPPGTYSITYNGDFALASPGDQVPTVDGMYGSLIAAGGVLNVTPPPYRLDESVHLAPNGSPRAFSPVRTEVALVLHVQGSGALLGPNGYNNCPVHLWPTDSGGSNIANDGGQVYNAMSSFCERTPAGGHFGPQLVWRGSNSDPGGRYVDLALRFGVLRLDGTASCVVCYSEGGIETAFTIDTWGHPPSSASGYNMLDYLHWASPTYVVGSDLTAVQSPDGQNSAWVQSAAGGVCQIFAFSSVSPPYAGPPTFTVINRPGQVTGLGSSVTAGVPTLTWTQPSVPVGSDTAIAFNLIYRSTSPGVTERDGASGVFPGRTTFVEPAALPSGTYYYRVSAWAHEAEGKLSNEIAVVVP